MACAVGLAAEPQWTIVRSASMTVIGDQPVALLRDIAQRLENFRAGVATLIQDAQRPAPMPTVVFVFGARKAIQPFLPLGKDGRPAAFGGFFHRDADVNYIALSLEGFDDNLPVVFHEYTHLLVRNAVRSVPVWLNEGLAEYYSTFAMAPNGDRVEAGRPVLPHVRLLRQRLLPVAELIAVDASSELYDEGVRRSMFYAEAWALTHYLMVEAPDGPAAINHYAREVAAGRRAIDAFIDAFGTTPAKFDERLRQYVRRPVFRSRTYDLPARVEAGASVEGRALSAGEANAWLGDLQRRVRRKTEATARIESAVRIDSESSIVQLALGLLRIDQGRTSEAWPALERAVALAPDDFLTAYAYGVSLLREAAQVDGVIADALALARSQSALRRATAINPGASDAWAWLAYADMLDDQQLQEAEDAITRAIELSPGRLDYRLRCADVSILRGRLDDARRMLSELAAVTTDRTVAERAELRLMALKRQRQ